MLDVAAVRDRLMEVVMEADGRCSEAFGGWGPLATAAGEAAAGARRPRPGRNKSSTSDEDKHRGNRSASCRPPPLGAGGSCATRQNYVANFTSFLLYFGRLSAAAAAAAAARRIHIL